MQKEKFNFNWRFARIFLLAIFLHSFQFAVAGDDKPSSKTLEKITSLTEKLESVSGAEKVVLRDEIHYWEGFHLGQLLSERVLLQNMLFSQSAARMLLTNRDQIYMRVHFARSDFSNQSMDIKMMNEFAGKFNDLSVKDWQLDVGFARKEAIVFKAVLSLFTGAVGVANAYVSVVGNYPNAIYATYGLAFVSAVFALSSVREWKKGPMSYEDYRESHFKGESGKSIQPPVQFDENEIGNSFWKGLEASAGIVVPASFEERMQWLKKTEDEFLKKPGHINYQANLGASEKCAAPLLPKKPPSNGSDLN